MRIAIMGSGGIGGLVGGRLGLAGNDVLFIARGAHLRAMRLPDLRDTRTTEFLRVSHLERRASGVLLCATDC